MNHREMFNEVVLSTKYPGCMPKVKRLAQLIRDDNPKLADEDCVTMALEKYEEMTGNYLDPTQEEWSEILDALHPASTQSKIKEEKTVDTINLLPEFCYSVSGSTGELIIIKRGENGYYPCSLSTDSAEKNKELMTFNNKNSAWRKLCVAPWSLALCLAGTALAQTRATGPRHWQSRPQPPRTCENFQSANLTRGVLEHCFKHAPF